MEEFMLRAGSHMGGAQQVTHACAYAQICLLCLYRPIYRRP